MGEIRPIIATDEATKVQTTTTDTAGCATTAAATTAAPGLKSNHKIMPTSTSNDQHNSSIIGLIVSCGEGLFCGDTDIGLCGGGFANGFAASVNYEEEVIDDILPHEEIGGRLGGLFGIGQQNSLMSVHRLSDCSSGAVVRGVRTNAKEDPEIIFAEEMKMISNIDHIKHGLYGPGDSLSCDSSISSGGKSYLSGEHRVRVTFDASLPEPSSKLPRRAKEKPEELKKTFNEQDYHVRGDHDCYREDKKADDLKELTAEVPVHGQDEGLPQTQLYLYPKARWAKAAEENSNDETKSSTAEEGGDCGGDGESCSSSGNSICIGAGCHFSGAKSVGGKTSGIWKSRLDRIDQERYDVRVLGTSINDQSTKPQVLTSSIMDTLQDYLPLVKRGESFWLKYSLVRDGADIFTMLKKVRGCKYTLLAVETLDGEVFGGFVGSEWRTKWGYYGSTAESFLWRLKHGRNEVAKSRSQKVLMDSECDVYMYSGSNRFVQLCKHDRIAIGGGSHDDSTGTKLPSELEDDDNESAASSRVTKDWGFGLIFEQNLLQGASSPCMTFQSPSLSKKHGRGTRFEILNLEVWTFSPCLNETEAQRFEDGLLTIEQSNTV